MPQKQQSIKLTPLIPWRKWSLVRIHPAEKISKPLNTKETTFLDLTPIIFILEIQHDKFQAINLNRMFSDHPRINKELIFIKTLLLDLYYEGELNFQKSKRDSLALKMIIHRILSLEQLEKRIGGIKKAVPSVAPRIRWFLMSFWKIEKEILPENVEGYLPEKSEIVILKNNKF